MELGKATKDGCPSAKHGKPVAKLSHSVGDRPICGYSLGIFFGCYRSCFAAIS